MVYIVQLTLDTNTFITTFTFSATIRFLTLHFLKKYLTIKKETTRNANFHALKHKALVINTDPTWFQASAAKKMRTAIFWVIAQRVVVISYWRFGATYRSNLPGLRILDSWMCVITEKSAVLMTGSTCSTSHAATRAASRHDDSTPLNTSPQNGTPRQSTADPENSLKTSSVRSVFQCLFTAASNTTLWQSLLPKTVRYYLQLNTATWNFIKF